MTQSEIIQILRKRAGLNQAELGSRAFNTTVESGRTKIKNIELGKQHASTEDLKKVTSQLLKRGLIMAEPSMDVAQKHDYYLQMMQKANQFNDHVLIKLIKKNSTSRSGKRSFNVDRVYHYSIPHHCKQKRVNR